MSAPSTSIIFSKYTDNSRFLNNGRIMFSSPYNKILHDPECQTNCCSRSFGQPMHAIILNDLEQYSNSSCNSAESIHTSTPCENRFFFDVNSSNDQLLKDQEDFRLNAVDNLRMGHTDFVYEPPIKITRYASYPININSSEERLKQRSYCKGVMKRKRKRTVFSTEQIVILEGVFQKRPYVCREERQFLSQRLHISEKAIKIWFQNRRRVTENRERDQLDSYQSDSPIEDVSNDYNTRLDFIESQLQQNTDEYGFVTLDGKALTELVKIIDSVLSHSFDFHEPLNENKNNESYLMYEPVSPESLSDDNKECENILKWEPSKPEESLQRLIDIHTVLY